MSTSPIFLKGEAMSSPCALKTSPHDRGLTGASRDHFDAKAISRRHRPQTVQPRTSRQWHLHLCLVSTPKAIHDFVAVRGPTVELPVLFGPGWPVSVKKRQAPWIKDGLTARLSHPRASDKLGMRPQKLDRVLCEIDAYSY